MNRSRYIAVALLSLLVAVAAPVAAVNAQSAGDDQYQDPLGPGNSNNGGGGGGGNAGGGSGGGTGQAGSGGGGGDTVPTQQAGTQSGDASGSGSSGDAPGRAKASGDDDGGLPNTGFPIAMLLIAGAALVVSGFQLRRNIQS